MLEARRHVANKSPGINSEPVLGREAVNAECTKELRICSTQVSAKKIRKGPLDSQGVHRIC